MKKFLEKGTICCSQAELRLDITLQCGQSFRWQETSPGEYTSALGGHVWRLSQTETDLKYSVFGSEKKTIDFDTTKIDILRYDSESPGSEEAQNIDESTKYSTFLSDYFQLGIKVKDLYDHWCASDPAFKKVAGTFRGVRILRQDPVENLFSFICSSNNHISRISSMVEKLCENYGDSVCDLDGKTYFSFPTAKALANSGVEAKLRQLGFGYRAKFISESAKYIVENPDSNWLYSLRKKPYDEAKSELMKLHGVGAKVADCVCLMSLDKHGAIPVDTHVWQIAARDYMPKLKSQKSLTEKLYKQIGDHFRCVWGDYAGWAQSVMFSADLKKFEGLKTGKKRSIQGNEGKGSKKDETITAIPKKKKKNMKR